MNERYSKAKAITVARGLEEMARFTPYQGTRAILERAAWLLRASTKRRSAMRSNPGGGLS